MNVLDIVIVLPLAWGLYKGIKNGLIIEIATLAALVAGVWGAMNFSDFTSEKIQEFFDFQSDYLPIISFAITFIAIVVLIHLLAKALEKIVKAIALGSINAIGGALFGVAKFACIVSIFILVLDRLNSTINFMDPSTIGASVLYQPLLSLSELIVGKVQI